MNDAAFALVRTHATPAFVDLDADFVTGGLGGGRVTRHRERAAMKRIVPLIRRSPLVRLVFTCLASLVVLTGCALHAPMSETLLFHEPYPTRPAHTADVTLGITATQTLVPRRLLETRELKLANPFQRAGGLYLGLYHEEIALSFSAGVLMLGADATFHLWGRNYASVLASFGGWRLTWLHRTMNTPYLGAALGLAVQRERFMFWCDGDFCTSGTWLTSAGVRAFGILRTAPTDNGVLHGGLYLGYAPAIRRPVLQLTLSFGNF